jgi:trehalose 6-phosphate phosphatase
LALFLDVDGTLLEIAATPDAVRVEPQLRALLRSLQSHTGGAVALISGRTIDKLDELFAPIPLMAAAGMHGFERRSTTGSYHRCPVPEEAVLQIARAGLQNIASRYPGTLVEDKQFALALHWRLVPELESTLLQEMELIVARVRPQLQLQPGKMVAELRPVTATKGEAVREFLQEAPFSGRWPIYIGDDLTDESAFECINNVGGVSIAVNVQRPTTARFSLPNVGAVHTWLASLPDGLPPRAAAAPVVHHEMTESIPLRF